MKLWPFSFCVPVCVRSQVYLSFQRLRIRCSVNSISPMGWTTPISGPLAAKRTLSTLWSLSQSRGTPQITGYCRFSTTRLNPSPTHYEVLGLSREATPKEIKDAYLSLSKAYHPDMATNVKSTSTEGPRPTTQEQEAQERARNTHFMAINEAYSILSKPKDRHIYDLGLHREHPIESDSNQGSGPYRTMYREPMSFDERAELFGFRPPDPNFYRSSRMHYFVAFGCICFAVAGYFIHMNIAHMVYDKHNLELAKNNDRLHKELEEFDQARLDFTAKYPTREESRKELLRRFADYESTRVSRGRTTQE